MDDSSDEKRQKFGTRYLTDPQNVFQHNAWDNVVWDEEQENEARAMTEKQAKHLVSDEKRDQYEAEANKFWDVFYGQHQNRFFKDRHWLFTEFPELHGVHEKTDETRQEDEGAGSSTQNGAGSEGQNLSPTEGCVTDSTLSDEESEISTENSFASVTLVKDKPFHMLEVGCGVGNTVFPVLKTNNNPNMMVYCCDFSSTAIDIVKSHPDYDSQRCHAFVHDITDESAEVPFACNSLDVIIMIFVLSAVNPDKMQSAVQRLASYLKPGGVLLFRDYGRYDMAQLRFKEDELKSMFETAGLKEKENLIDRRLQVNRGRQLKMYRVWIQCKYVKPDVNKEDDCL